jgi:diguanylate cyclase (GGDEF)-like protein
MVEEHLDKSLLPDGEHTRPEQERAEHIKYLNLITEKSDRQKLDELGSNPTLCAYHDEKHRWLFPDVAPNPRSIAVLPLARRGRVMGSLNLGSQDPYRFANGARTDFLSRLAAVAGICIENTLNFHRLRTAGMTDALTGIKNRRFFNERMLEEVSRAHRNQQPLTFLLLDIDRFKHINDTHGHLAGDRILRDVAQRIARALRVTDVLTRYGGEEFAAILPDTDAEVGCQVAERIRTEISDDTFYLANGEALSATISIGAAVVDEEQPGKDLEEQVHELTEQADRALLDAKERGRNRVVCAGRRLDT